MSYIGKLACFDYKSSEWDVFKGQLNQFFIVNDVQEVKKSAVLLTHLTEESYRLLRDLAYPTKLEEFSFTELIILLDTHFKPRKCSYAERAKFYGAVKHPEETLPDWAARLRGLASYCGFGTALEQNLTDRFVLGLGAGSVRDKLFERDATNLKLAEALDVAQKAESAREAKRMSTTMEAVAIKEEPVYRAIYKSKKSGGGGSRKGGDDSQGSQVLARDQQSVSSCLVCGHFHSGGCRFKDYRCRKCGIVGHLKRVCKAAVSRVNNIETKSESGVMCCGECRNFNIRYVKPIKLNVTLDTVNMYMELDSGSGASVISDRLYYEKFSSYKLNPCDQMRMCLYNGHKIAPLGYFKINVQYNGDAKMIVFYVIKNGGPPLLGRDFMSAFNLALTVQINNLCSDSEVQSLLEQYSVLWKDELGTFKNFRVKLVLKENAIPKFLKARTVPFALKEKVEKELDRLVGLGILIPVSHSEYATPIVPVLKDNGSVRIAGDFSTTLNKDLVIDKYPLPRIEEVFAKLGGGEHYSKLDLKNAYNQFVLTDSSRSLTTINTSKGLFQYTRLVYGLANAPAIFQKSMETLLTGIDGVSCWLDDICITGPNKKVHIERLKEVLSRLNDAGLRLRKEKCEFFKSSVTYLGFTINSNGLQTSADKVKAILNAPEPTNVADVKRFLGIVNYYRNFIPKASAVMEPLHELLRAGSEWRWGDRQREAVRQVKRELASERVLAHFDPAAQLVLSVDAGPAGLGAVLAQRDCAGQERPIAYASRSLAPSERNYSQIQKEATAIIFGVKKFHQYLYGLSQPFILKTDHRPLVSIFNNKNGISVTTALRLQRYAIILSAYNYIVQYTSSENNVVADYFSRAPLSDTSCDRDRENVSYVSNNFLDAALPAVKLEDVIKATNDDRTIQTVRKYMVNGWPKKIFCKTILPFFQCKSDLQFEKGVLLRGHRIVIPMALREHVLSELHSTHLGIIKSKNNARERFWWPNLDADLQRWIGACEVCVSQRAAPPREPPAPWPAASGPWQRIHIDYMTVGQRVYLVVVDAYSKWVECLHMHNGTATQALIAKLKSIFSTFGIPHVLISDNDAKINCKQFNLFCSNNGIKYMTSPIYHPASNGQAENSVRTCKKMLKCILSGSSSQHIVHEKLLGYLFNYRNTVHCTTGETPAKLMFGRGLRTRLDLMLPSDRINNHVNSECERKRKFVKGDLVWARFYGARKESWKLCTVTEIIGNRMYKLQTVNDDFLNCIIRHVDQLIKYTGGALQESDDLMSTASSLAPPPTPRPSRDSSAEGIQDQPCADVSEVNEVVEREETDHQESDEWDDCEDESERGPVAGAPRAASPSAQLACSPASGDSVPPAPVPSPTPAPRMVLRPRAKVDYKKHS